MGRLGKMKKIIFGTYRTAVYTPENFHVLMMKLNAERALDIPLLAHLFRAYHVGAPYHLSVIFNEFQGDALQPHPETVITLLGKREPVNLLEQRIYKENAALGFKDLREMGIELVKSAELVKA